MASQSYGLIYAFRGILMLSRGLGGSDLDARIDDRPVQPAEPAKQAKPQQPQHGPDPQDRPDLKDPALYLSHLVADPATEGHVRQWHQFIFGDKPSEVLTKPEVQRLATACRTGKDPDQPRAN